MYYESGMFPILFEGDPGESPSTSTTVGNGEVDHDTTPPPPDDPPRT